MPPVPATRRIFLKCSRAALPVVKTAALALLLCAPDLSAQRGPAPDWTRGVLWYRLIVDRFCNGDTGNDPKASDVFSDKTTQWEVSSWTGNWYTRSVKESLFNRDFHTNAFLRQYGGDLDGLLKKLGYLKALGVGALLLSPVFESNSSHKFDVNSYHHIDPHFGPRILVDTAILAREVPENPKSWYWTAADRKFIELIKAAHDSGMKVVVDVQFAHVSADFWAFRDLLQKQERSAFAGWFTVEDWDRPETPYASEFRYKSMWGIPAFPELHKDSLGLAPALKEYVFTSTRRWMDPNGDGDPSDGIDGWRIELADELAPLFWDQWTGLVKAINPAAVLIGNRITEPPPSKRRFDLEESSRFARMAVRMILNRRATPTMFEQELTAERGTLEYADLAAQMNWIGNHETDRVASMCVNRDNPFDAGNTLAKNPMYAVRKPLREERALQRLLVLLQFTYPGAPMLYYGDEAGMWGGDDPECRKPMLWPEYAFEAECAEFVNGDKERYSVAFDSSLYQYYRALIELREKNIALRSGSHRVVLLDNRRQILGYARQSGANRVFVLINYSDEPQECRLLFTDVLEGTKIDAPLQRMTFYADRDGLTVTVPARTGTVLIPRM